VRFARSTVALSARMCEGFLVFLVEDDGSGLGAKSARSTGLGTVLCSAIAQAHRNGSRAGKVVLRNRPEGGAAFEMWLP
jgi:two-component sensor histidine kinase